MSNLDHSVLARLRFIGAFVLLVLFVARTNSLEARASARPKAAPHALVQDGKSYAELLVDLGDPDGRKRRVAVRRLSELGTEAAWERVLEHLTDDDAQVADEAQIRLATLTDAGIWTEHAFGKLGLRHKDVLVRRRVVEALGRAAAPLDDKLLGKLIGDSDAETRRLAAWSIERLALGGGPAGLDAAARGRLAADLAKVVRTDSDGAVSGAALLALQALGIDSDWRVVAQKLLASRQSGARVGALIALGRAGDDEAVGLVRSLAQDASVAVRIEVVRSLEAAQSLAGAQALVELLEREPQKSLAIRIAEALQRLSGFKHRTDPRPWRDWLDALPPDWTPQSQGAVFEPITVTKLVGLPIRSERLAILIDMSGSMWQSRPDGRKTKDLVDVEVRRCLEGLPPTARFNVVPYATLPQAYSEELVEASPKKVAKALEWFESNTLRGKGNVWDAIELALQDPNIDTLVIMTDGAPTGGPHWNLELMVPLLLEKNRFRNVVFDVLLSDTNAGLAEHWKRLAAATGGTCLEVAFDS